MPLISLKKPLDVMPSYSSSFSSGMLIHVLYKLKYLPLGECSIHFFFYHYSPVADPGNEVESSINHVEEECDACDN
eukprot:14702863-Ditylum_brightwellii.AAC.1